jgi:hypothetical protein
MTDDEIRHEFAELNRRVSELMEVFRLCAVRIDSLKKTLGPEALAVYEKHAADWEDRWRQTRKEKKEKAIQDLFQRILEQHDGVEQ